MNDIEDLLIRTLRDPARALPVRTDPMPAIRARIQRRSAALAVAAVVLVTVAAIVVPTALGHFTRPTPAATDGPPAGAGLIPWSAQGPQAPDRGLVAGAVRTWQGSSGLRPERALALLWAGMVDGRSIVLLQALDAEGRPWLARVDGDAVQAEPITDPSVAAIRAAGTHIVVQPGAQRVLLLGTGDLAVLPAVAATGVRDGLATFTGGFEDFRFHVVVLDADGQILGDSDGSPYGLALRRGTVRLAMPSWKGPGRTPTGMDYADATLLANRLNGAGPVEAAVVGEQGWVLPHVPGGRVELRFSEVRRGGRTWLGSVMWIGERPACVQLDDVTGRVGAVGAIVARCWLRGSGQGIVAVLVADGSRMVAMDLRAGAGTSERQYRRTFEPPAERLWSDTFGVDFPTGTGSVTVTDYAGRTRSALELPAYAQAVARPR